MRGGDGRPDLGWTIPTPQNDLFTAYSGPRWATGCVGNMSADLWAPTPAGRGVGDAELDSLQYLAFHCIPQII